jgi:nucleoside-diphosphate-sugar epimerase
MSEPDLEPGAGIEQEGRRHSRSLADTNHLPNSTSIPYSPLMRVLIVGCGYVGLPLGAALARLGNEVFGLRREPWSAAGPESAGIKPLGGDITRPEDLARLPAGYDWVVNCVSSSGGGAEQYRSIYVQGTRNLLQWLAARPPGKFVYTSSTAVYGQNDGSTVDEAAPTEPLAATARVLLEAEKVLLEAARQSGFPAIIARLAAIYGPGRGYWFKQYLSGQGRMEAGGGRILNMIHRDDVVGVLIALLERGRAGEIYNAVDDEPVTQLGCFQWLSGVLGRPLPPGASQDPAASSKRGLANKRVSNRKLKSQLGYTFRYPSFRQGYEPEIAAAVSMSAATRAQSRAESEGE